MAYTDAEDGGVTDSNGALTLAFRNTTAGRLNWTVRQVTTEGPTLGGNAVCTIYVNNKFVCQVNAQLGSAGGDPPIPVRNGATLFVKWTAALANKPAKAVIWYDDGTPDN